MRERIDFELDVMKKMGFSRILPYCAGLYTGSSRHEYLGGPGRGSAAGSVVAYCLKITNIDPMKYDLLF